jgi:hypothetical protein
MNDEYMLFGERMCPSMPFDLHYLVSLNKQFDIVNEPKEILYTTHEPKEMTLIGTLHPTLDQINQYIELSQQVPQLSDEL